MTRKKIFDITPSKKELKEPLAAEEIKLELSRFNRKPVSNKRNLTPLFLGIVLLTGGALSYFFIPHKVTVEIWPEQKIIEETVIVLVGAGQGSRNYIKGQIAEEEKTVSQSFAATGTKLKSVKAQGVIRVYNNYSTASQPLLANTRFVSDDGKLFRTPVRVVIPGGRYEGGKLVPGFADIEVLADQPGEDFNINPSAFSIPGFAGTPKYTAFYGKSFEYMKGGLLKEVSQISQADLDKAKETLIAQAASEAKAVFKSSFSSEGNIVFEEAIAKKLEDFKPDAEAGKDQETFTAQARAVVRGLVFKELDLENFAINYVKSKILPEEKLIDSFLKIEYLLESINLAKSELSIKLSISARSYSGPEDVQIKEMIKNKSAKDIESIIKSISGIGKAKVDFWPFWVKVVPDNLEDIEVVWHLD